LIPIPGDPFDPEMNTPTADCLSGIKLASIGVRLCVDDAMSWTSPEPEHFQFPLQLKVL